MPFSYELLIIAVRVSLFFSTFVSLDTTSDFTGMLAV
nr:MAG TPA: hypothetical protein [Caudoviricetes sp.]